MRTVEWVNGKVRMIDQRQLPWELIVLEFDNYEMVASAISDMVVRGAPAIGIAGAFGLALAAYQFSSTDNVALLNHLTTASRVLSSARPTAVNLNWALGILLKTASNDKLRSTQDIKSALLLKAQTLADDDVATNKRIGKHGATLLNDGDTILHHCNTGALAAVDWGTALGVIRTAHELGKRVHVLLNETRPRLQGARLSAWELKQYGISFEIIADNAAGYFMHSGQVNIVMVGSDRTAANGDVANKIGTYSIAVLAKENGLPFYAVLPTSTIDLSLASGAEIPIEERSLDEIRTPHGYQLIPADYPARNPAFDVTPHKYVTGIVTENGIVRPPYQKNLQWAVAGIAPED